MQQERIQRSRMTLLDQFSVMAPKNLRELLGVGDEADATVPGADAGTRRTGVVTLASILESEKNGGRTLLDIIREEDGEGEAHGSAPFPGGGVQAQPEVEEGPAFRVSLMTLLALADGMEREEAVSNATGGCDRGISLLTVAKVEGEMEDGEAVSAADERMACCVCMARKKGAAFIPCGHTFCRVCSRDLWTSRGSCPLCNSLIFDILDIF